MRPTPGREHVSSRDRRREVERSGSGGGAPGAGRRGRGAQGDRRAARARRPDDGGAPVPRPPAGRGRARPRQDAGGEDARAGARPPVRAHPVHSRPAARRPRRHARLPAEVGRVRGAQGTGLHEPAARRRDQPRSREGAVGSPRVDAGAPGDARRRDAPAAGSLPGLRDPEPDRAGGHLPAAGGAGRPLSAEGEGGLPDPGGGAPGARPHDLGRSAPGREGAVGRRRAPARRPRARGLHGRAAARLHGRARRRDARPARGGPRRAGPAHRLRRLAPRDTFVLRGVARRRVPPRPRLRGPRGRQGDREGRAAPPRAADLRSRSRERHERHGSGTNTRAGREFRGHEAREP